MWLNVAWVNYGRSPALRVSQIGKIIVGQNAMDEADRFFAGLGNDPFAIRFPDRSLKNMVIPQGIPSDPDKTFGGFYSIYTDHALTDEEQFYIMKTDRPVAIIARIEYYDGYGTRHWSDVCWSRFRQGTIPHCDEHNEMH
jgi:hypothetical protein